MVIYWVVFRVGQNRIYTYIYTVYLVIFKPKIRRIYIWFWPTLVVFLPKIPEADNSPQNGHVVRMFPVYGPPNLVALN